MEEYKKIHRFDEVFDSQRLFRLILKALSRPGSPVNIKEIADRLYGAHPGLLAVALTLLDNEVSFCACGDEELAASIVSLTLSREALIEQADFFFLPDPALVAKVIPLANCGTLRDPHRSATLVIRNAGEPCTMRLAGPGIKGVAEVKTTELVKTALELRDSQCYEYPQGIDMLFVADDGGLLAIPRLVGREAR